MRHFPMGPQIAIAVAICAALQAAAGSADHRQPPRVERVPVQAPGKADAITIGGSFSLRVPVLQ